MKKRWQVTTDSNLYFAGWGEDPRDLARFAAKRACTAPNPDTTIQVFVENLDDLSENYTFQAAEFVSEVLLARNTKWYCTIHDKTYTVHAETPTVAAVRAFSKYLKDGHPPEARIVFLSFYGPAIESLGGNHEVETINLNDLLLTPPVE